MDVQLFLLALALLLRGEGAALRRAESQPILQFCGRFVSLLAIWMATVAAGAWPPVWPLLLVTLVGFGFQRRAPERGKASFFSVALDAVLVITSSLFSVPPPEAAVLLAMAVLLPAIAFTIDRLVALLLERLSWIIIATAGLLPLLLIVLLPGIGDTGARILSSRFVYLAPGWELASEPLPVAAEATATPLGEATTEVAAATAAGSPATELESGGTLDASSTQWTPYLEWSLANDSYGGNPYDLVATATFVHSASGETHTTGMFYDGAGSWRWRFTGTQPGPWTFTTKSGDPELDGHAGTVEIRVNPGATGFVTNYGDKWGRTGIDQAFVPQLVMIGGPHTYYNNPAEIEYNIQTFLVEHGFNGVHTPVFCRWFNIEQQQCGRVNVRDPNPDPRTFAALETLISEVHGAGGIVHIWMWGDDSRSENPKRWGINGAADRRLQRYIAARLGPLPGWTMGYGYDLFEWVTEDELTAWHDYMQAHLGWRHYLGARSSKNELDQLSEAMDYSAYEQHRPDYEQYVITIEARPGKPSFSEDRFRIRDEGEAKDYNMEETRRGLWHSTMAGGVANIWGNLLEAPGANDGATTSAPYPDPDSIRTYSRFFEGRFYRDMIRCNDLTNGVCLMRPGDAHYVFYKEETSTVFLNLSGMDGPQTAVAVDTRLSYEEIALGQLAAAEQSWTAPYESDWAIAVGDFQRLELPTFNLR